MVISTVRKGFFGSPGTPAAKCSPSCAIRRSDVIAEVRVGAADEVLHLMDQRVQGGMLLAAVYCPVAGLVGRELDRPHAADRHVSRHLRAAGAFACPAAIRAGHLERVAVLV